METETKCPHCKGDLVKAKEWNNWDYECKRCGRVWKLIDHEGKTYWLAGFDAGAHVYKKGKKRFESIEEFISSSERENLRHLLFGMWEKQEQKNLGIDSVR